ncbi:hypothetical protein MIR68_002113 [Amoeboaphelidium protococcarum]|nr:hypothetical protein MIR68_002113 [Amoeboaphelidium protococcarum]
MIGTVEIVTVLLLCLISLIKSQSVNITSFRMLNPDVNVSDVNYFSRSTGSVPCGVGGSPAPADKRVTVYERSVLEIGGKAFGGSAAGNVTAALLIGNNPDFSLYPSNTVGFIVPPVTLVPFPVPVNGSSWTLPRLLPAILVNVQQNLFATIQLKYSAGSGAVYYCLDVTIGPPTTNAALKTQKISWLALEIGIMVILFTY